MFIAMIGWGASWVHAKVLSAYINEYELIFLRNIFTVIAMLPILFFSKKSYTQKNLQNKFHQKLFFTKNFFLPK